MVLKPKKKIGPLFRTKRYSEVKDPCVAFDGELWHIFGSGVSKTGSGLEIVHATSPDIEGPWTEQESADLGTVATMHVGAPGVVFDRGDGHFHMAVQDDFTGLGGKIDYHASKDAHSFPRISAILGPIPHSAEAGLYDPHLCELSGEKYLVYAGMKGDIDRSKPFIPQPDIFLAKSESGLWAGPWKRLGKILDHDDISWHHNRRDHPDYEWGIEGPQILEIGGIYLLIATCFLESGNRGSRQRVFFAVSSQPAGPYKTIGPAIAPTEPWESGENGHATGWVKDGMLYVFYQGRSYARGLPSSGWRYGIAVFDIRDVISAADKALAIH